MKDSKLKEGKQIYEADKIHPMNPEFLDEYQDEDDPGFDTYVVNEENFVASCQELARLNDFPERAIMPDNKKDMAARERLRKEQLTQQEKLKDRKTVTSMSKKLKHTDSALLLSQMSKNKKRGKDVDEKEMEALREISRDNKSESETVDHEDGAAMSILPKWVKFPTSADDFYPAEFDKVIYDCYNLKVVFDREKTGFEETKDFPIVINSIIAGRYQVVEYLGSAAFSKAI